MAANTNRSIFLNLGMQLQPPTETEIATVRRNQRFWRCLGLSCLTVLTVGLLIAKLPGMLWLPILLLCMAIVLAEDVVPNYQDLDPSQCLSLFAMCLETKEGQQYRQKVLAEGRKFLQAEQELIAQWSLAAKQQSVIRGYHLQQQRACKALYGIPN